MCGAGLERLLEHGRTEAVQKVCAVRTASLAPAVPLVPVFSRRCLRAETAGGGVCRGEGRGELVAVWFDRGMNGVAVHVSWSSSSLSVALLPTCLQRSAGQRLRGLKECPLQVVRAMLSERR